MCCRFYVPGKDNEEYREFLSEIKNPEQLSMFGDVHPADTVAVLANNRNRQPVPFAMKWGYTEFEKLIINTRSETAAEKPLFRDGILNRRCLIPAAYYYEWDKNKNKYRIGSDSNTLIWLAGIYRFEGDVPVFSILTREPSAEMKHIHDRMPVIFSASNKKEWLTEADRIEDLISESEIPEYYEICEK